MKAALLTLSVSRQAGGLLDCVRALALEMNAGQEVAPEILGLADAHTAAELPSWRELPVHVFPRRFGFAAPGMAESLRDLNVPLAHTHGLWSYCSLAVNRWGRQTGRPYLVSPQGMLDVWALKNSSWKKWIAGRLFERRHLEDAACLHAVCASEVDAMRAYGLRNRVCVIPNGVNLPPEEDARTPGGRTNGVPHGQKTLLFLGRLHPKKGLPNLLRAWSAVARQNPGLAQAWRLRVVGWNQGSHAQELRALVTDLGLQAAVEFVGPLFGEAKTKAFRDADAFVLPSFSEGLPLSVLEAWSYRLPVLMTPECNIPEGFAADAAFRADPQVPGLTTALHDLFQASDGELRNMGDRGRALVEQRFTWTAAAREMTEVYQWLVEGHPRPGCVNDASL